MTDTIAWRSARYPITLRVRPDSSDVKAAAEVLDQNGYQRPNLGFRLADDDRWLDAGANVGAFTVLAAWHRATVVAVEPLPVHLDLLQRNASHYDRVTILPGAVTAPDGPKQVTIHMRNEPAQQWRSSSVWDPDHKATTPVTVPGLPIDRLVADHRINAVKIDIEGAEHEILERWTPPTTVRKLVFEWSFDSEPDTRPLRSVIARLDAQFARTSYHNVVNRADHWDPKWFPHATLVFAWNP